MMKIESEKIARKSGEKTVHDNKKGNSDAKCDF